MKEFFKLTVLATFLLAASAGAQVSNVDLNLQRIYRHFTGQSLKDDIERLEYLAKSGFTDENNVIVRLNGGGENDKVFIGTTNTLEVLISNTVELGGMSLGFEFVGSWGDIQLIEGYGSLPSSGSYIDIAKVHSAALGGAVLDCQINMTGYPGRIGVGGVVTSTTRIPIHTTPVLLFSLQFYVPVECAEVIDGFSVDNIFIPIFYVWAFSNASGTTLILPNFQGNANTSVTIPDAPPAYFDVVNEECYWTSPEKSIVPVQVAPPPETLSTAEAASPPGTYRMPSGELGLIVGIKFDGNVQDLKDLGVNVNDIVLSGNRLRVMFPLRLLPEVARVKGVFRVYTGGRIAK